MLTNAPPLRFQRRRGRRKPVAQPAPVPNQITRVRHGENANEIIVTVSNPLDSLVFSEAMEVSVDESGWIQSTGGNLDNQPDVLLTFGEDVSGCEFWELITGDVWVFVNGGLMEGPISGSIE